MKILIVDDEPGAASRLAEGVDAAGIGECFAAGDAEAAVEIVNREGDVDLLVTDVFMDGINGFTLYETLRPHMPGLRTIFLAERDIAGDAARADGWPVLAKPVEPGALADFIREFCAPAAATPAAPVTDPLAGTTLGSYRIESVLGADRDGNFYHAVQTSIERVVELHTLDPLRATDPAEVERFLADARTKANVHHPALLSVFEAGQQNGVYFYTSEPRGGSSLASLAAQGSTLEPRIVLQLLHSIADVMVHLGHEKVAHEALAPEHILVDHRMRTRLVNTATAAPSGVSAVQEMQGLAAIVAPVLADSEASPAIRQMLFEMESESVTLRSWNALLYEVKRCASGATTPHSHRLDSTGRAAIEAVGAARKRHRAMRQIIIAASILIPLAVGGFVVWKQMQPKPVAVGPEANPAFETMQKIPAGEFSVDGKKIMLPDFWIDTHEITIGQYADFLAWIDTHPGELNARLGDIPADVSYVPKGWADETQPDGTIKAGYHSLARAGGVYGGQKLTLDSPVFGVDWLDAGAYAKWKGRRLPTAGEWKKAATGVEGKKYPWGEEWKLGSANVAAGDGFEKWSPVDAFAGDLSPYGVIGMAGNVSEWTSGLGKSDAGKATGEVLGGNWSDALLDMNRAQNLEASESAPTVGFRTVSDKSPEK
jgi:formylglycine-generating enzyme required for sulfatase activity/CheY-like chemotaxis protein